MVKAAKVLYPSTDLHNMGWQSQNALDAISLYKEYTRQELHQLFNDGTRYSQGSGVWGRSGVVRPKLDFEVYLLFCQINTGASKGRLQKIKKNGEFQWLSQASMFPGQERLNSIISAAGKDSRVLLFGKQKPGPKYIHLGVLSYVSLDETLSKPTIVTWKVTPWPAPKQIMEKFITS